MTAKNQIDVNRLSRWREVVWTDEDSHDVKRVACHESELVRVMDMPFPPGAVVLEPVRNLTSICSSTKFFCRFPYQVGDTFTENINQGDRDCLVIAVDDATGDYLYDYEMPAGKKFLRDHNQKPVSAGRIPKKFQQIKTELEK